MKHVKKHLSILSILFVLSLVIFTSCTGEKEKEEDLICKVSVVSGEGGTATTSDTEVMSRWAVTLTATPKATYRFVNWTVGGKEVNRKNPCIITVTTSTQFKANFEKDNYKVTVIAGEGGTAEASRAGDVLNGTEVTFTAIPAEGYSFINWIVNREEVSRDKTYTTAITKDIEIKANFYLSKGIENGHNWVDLDLPSGLKWATCNVGATTPEGYGDYFAWGETQPKDYYDWRTYKYCNGSWHTQTKYCGTVDNKTTLELSDDAARVNWGGKWRMPTSAEQEELIDTNNCTREWTTQNGVNGYKVTSKKNGNSIFLPAAGCRYYGSLHNAGLSGNILSNAGNVGHYWSSSLHAVDRAYYLGFSSGSVVWYYYDRFFGQSVRAVCE